MLQGYKGVVGMFLNINRNRCFHLNISHIRCFNEVGGYVKIRRIEYNLYSCNYI